MIISHPKRFWFVFGLALFISALFLYFSRVPELSIKSLSSPSDIFSSLITHDPLLVLLEYETNIIKILKHSLNWLYANYKGMLFGIFLGGAAKSLFRYLQFKKEHGSFGGAFMGLLAGSPLSVCVNCASPIMKGMLSSKQKVFALSVMFSSPSMNFIILTMLFSLLPFYLAFAKIFFNLIFILITLPLINSVIGKRITFIESEDSKTKDEFFKPSKSWLKEFKSSLKLFFEDLKFIFIRTAPLMILASVFVSVLLVFDYGLEDLPSNFITLSITSLLGLLFPVPMAIDILLVAGLFSIGVNTNITLALLFSLGISSIYSLAIVWRALSAWWAVSLFLSLFLMTVLMAPMGSIAEKLYIKSVISYSGKILNNPAKLPDKMTQANTIEKKKTRLKKAQIKKEWTLIEKQDELSLYGQKFNKQENPVSKKFTKLEGKDIGLDKAYEPDNIDLLFPLWFRGIASADINQDGLDDLVFGSNEGPVIYKNRGGGGVGFELQKFLSSTNESLPDLNSLIVFLVALIDFNNDNYPDLFFTTWSDGNYLVPNINGSYDWSLAKKLPNQKALLTMSASFADFDKNGFIDIVNGNTLSIIPLSYIKIDGERINSILYNQAELQFREKALKSNPAGDTLSILNGDFNKDGFVDIIVSNDFEAPDFLYLNKGGAFEMSSLSSLGIEKITEDAMSYNIGDLNNDLIEDLFLSGTVEDDMSRFKLSKKYFQNKWNNRNCLHIKDKKKQNHCFELYLLKKYHPNIDEPAYHFLKCSRLKKYSLKQDCLANNLIGIILYQSSFFKQNPLDCGLFSKRYRVLKDICQLRLKAQSKMNIKEEMIEKQEKRHYIYMGKDKGLFRELLSEKNDSVIYPKTTGWSWNSQIADYDNDGLQDIFIVNGSVDNEKQWAKLFFEKSWG